MLPFDTSEWATGGTPVLARLLQKRIFEGETEFPVGTTVAYKYSQMVTGVRTKIAYFNGEMWEVTGDPHAFPTVDLFERLKGPMVLKVWLLDDGATIYQRDEKEQF